MRAIVAFCALHHERSGPISNLSACHGAAFVAPGLVKAVTLDDIRCSRGGNVFRSPVLIEPRSQVRCPLHWMELS